MKRILFALLLAVSAQAQPIIRQSFTTNSVGATPPALPTHTSALFPVSVLNPNGAGADRAFHYTPGFSLTESNMTVPGNLSISGRTNRLTISSGGTLLLDGVEVASNTTTNNYNTIISTNNFFISGKGNTLVITQALTITALKTNILATDSSGLITNVVVGSGLAYDSSTRTLTSTGGGGGGSTNYRSSCITLTMSGSNVTANSIDWNLTNVCYKLVLTNNAFFGEFVFTNTPTTADFQWLNLYLIQDSTGGRLVTWTNSIFAGVNGTFPVTTNANALDVLACINSPVTNGNVLILPSNNLHR